MFNVAIDGPAGAGKSTIAKAAAEKLEFIYVDTGALYRTIGYAADNANTDISDDESLQSLLDSIKIELKFENNTQTVLLNGEDVSDVIRTPKASMKASDVSKIPSVRDFLLDLQRNIAKKNNVIMDGRDIATVVLPEAQVKIFLTASPQVRAERRYKELCEKGRQVAYNDILNDMMKRDYQDMHRDVAPLKPADDSICIDSSELTFEQAVAEIIKLIEEKL